MLTKILMGSSLYIFLSNFSKKLVSLLSLELAMVVLILSFFMIIENYSLSLFSLFLIFLVMMVLDSVLGICILISACRTSSKSTYSFF